MLIGLFEVNDLELVNEDSVLSPSVCSASDRENVRKMAEIIAGLYRDFNYFESPEFLQSLAGKSETFKQVKSKLLSDPVKQTELRRRLGEALVSIMRSDDAYNLFPERNHHSLKELERLVSSVSNPDEVTASA